MSESFNKHDFLSIKEIHRQFTLRAKPVSAERPGLLLLHSHRNEMKSKSFLNHEGHTKHR